MPGNPDYRRQARRLRAAYVGRPARLHVALRDLARQLDRCAPTRSQVIQRGFADGVADRLSRGPFTYTDRAALLAAGEKLGIDRFRANLIVALRQQEVGRPTPSHLSPLPSVAAAVLVQLAVAAAGFWAWLA